MSIAATLAALRPTKETQSAAMKVVRKFKAKQASDDDTETASDEEHGANMLQQTRILWRPFETHTIDLSVMCDNENDKYAMHLSEMPQCMQFSLDNKEKIDFREKEPTIRENLLQIAVRDRIVVFDVGEDFEGTVRKVREIHVFNASRQFIKPDTYVESGFDVVMAYDDPTKAIDGYLVDRIIQNRSKELCFAMQTRVNLDSSVESFADLAQTPICLSIFKKYAEADLIELQRI